MKRIDMSNTKHQQNLRRKAEQRDYRRRLLDQFAVAAMAGTEANVATNKWTGEMRSKHVFACASDAIAFRDKIVAAAKE